MSVDTSTRPPMGDAPARANAKETLWRLTALALAHPDPEFYRAHADGRFHAAFSGAWAQLTGRPWPLPDHAPDFPAFESGYIRAFGHGPGGKPVAALLAGEHDHLLAGLSRPVFMLNIAGFYRHFGLKPATSDEGRADEPDHLSAMCEFMAVLCHVEARALAQGRDPSDARRAQRDFLSRFLAPMLRTVSGLLSARPVADLDPGLVRLLADMSGWAEGQIAELEARVGSYRDPDAPRPAAAEPSVAQNLWG